MGTNLHGVGKERALGDSVEHVVCDAGFGLHRERGSDLRVTLDLTELRHSLGRSTVGATQPGEMEKEDVSPRNIEPKLGCWLVASAVRPDGSQLS